MKNHAKNIFNFFKFNPEESFAFSFDDEELFAWYMKTQTFYIYSEGTYRREFVLFCKRKNRIPHAAVDIAAKASS